MNFYSFYLSSTFEVIDHRCISKGRKHSGVRWALLAQLSFLLFKIQVFKNEWFLSLFTKSNDLSGGITNYGSNLVFGAIMKMKRNVQCMKKIAKTIGFYNS